MVRLREARRAFRTFHTQCFWSTDRDYVVTTADIPWVAERLMTYGGRRGWEIGRVGARRRRGRYHQQDFARLKLTAPVDLRELKRQWLAALEDDR